MDNQASYFGILPAEVRYNKEITDFAKILYAEFMALSNTYGYCFATNKYFAELYNKDADTISRAVTQLRRCGFIKVDIIDSFQRKIYPLVAVGVRQNNRGGTTKTSEGYDENVDNNNIINNKHNIYTTTSKAVVDYTPKKTMKNKKATTKIKKTYIETITPPYYQIPENFNWDELLKFYSEHKDYGINIVAYYCKIKNKIPQNWGQVKKLFDRHYKASKEITDYSVEDIKRVMDKLNRDMPVEFTIETVYKYLTK